MLFVVYEVEYGIDDYLLAEITGMYTDAETYNRQTGEYEKKKKNIRKYKVMYDCQGDAYCTSKGVKYYLKECMRLDTGKQER